MRRASATTWFLFAFVAVSSPAWAQSPPETSLAIGGRLWVTSGYSTNSTGLSELRWRGVDSVVPEVNVDFVLNRLVLMGSIGGGVIKQGVLIDEDFNDRDHDVRISRTRSDADDTGLLYINVDVGYRLLRWGEREQPGFIDVLGGFQYWHERYVAFGATSAFPSVVPAISSGQKVITQDWDWYSFRLGGRTQVPIFGGLSAKARAFVLPWSKSVVDDIHHLRSDVRHDPSFRSEADGGVGVQLDGGLTYRVWRGLSVEAGYQYWWIKSGEGTLTARTPDGDFEGKLFGNRIERHGPYVGLQYRF
jgi:opacity protein-like surface antigen